MPAPAAAPAVAEATKVAAASDRPEGLPDTYWDATANALKVDAESLVKDLRERDELKAFKATEDSRKLTLPQKADDYQIKLPEDFKPPEGVTFEFKTDDPLLAQARELAHAKGIDQETFSQMLGLYAGAQVQDQSVISAARTAEVAKLGVNGPARVDAVTTWLKSVGGNDADILVRTLEFAPVAGTVMAFENMMRKFAGGSGFSQQHRQAPDANKIENYDNMSFEQRRAEQDKRLSARR